MVETDDRPGETPLDGFLVMIRSASSRHSAEIVREQIEQGHHKVLSGALPGELAAQRAALILALVAGVQIMRQGIGLSALAEAEDLAELMAPLLQRLADGEA
jgi:hypothetical protein